MDNVVQGYERAHEQAVEDAEAVETREIPLALARLDDAMEYLAQAVDEVRARLDAGGVLASPRPTEALSDSRSVETGLGGTIQRHVSQAEGMRAHLVETLDRLQI